MTVVARSLPRSSAAADGAGPALGRPVGREAAERYAFDTRWRYAAGVGSYDTGGWTIFSHTVFVDMRERLRVRRLRTGSSRSPLDGREASRSRRQESGCSTRRRSMTRWRRWDTITLIRSAIRNLLKVADRTLSAELRSVISERGRVRELREAGDRLGRPRSPSPADRQSCERRLCAVSAARRAPSSKPPVEQAGCACSRRWPDRTWRRTEDGNLRHCPPRRARPGHLCGRPRGRAMVERPRPLISMVSKVMSRSTRTPRIITRRGGARQPGTRASPNTDRRSVGSRRAGRVEAKQTRRRSSERASMATRPYGTGEAQSLLFDAKIDSEVQDPATCWKERAVRKGPVPSRPRDRHGHCRRDHRANPALTDKTGVAEVQASVCNLSARRAVHHLTTRTPKVASGCTRPPSHGRAPNRPIRNGETTTGRRGRRSNGNLGT